MKADHITFALKLRQELRRTKNLIRLIESHLRCIGGVETENKVKKHFFEIECCLLEMSVKLDESYVQVTNFNVENEQSKEEIDNE